jgi:hypothetical protein
MTWSFGTVQGWSRGCTFRPRRNNVEPFTSPSVVSTEVADLAHKNERVELEMKIMKYRQMADLAISDELTRQRIRAFIAELEQKLREIDE